MGFSARYHAASLAAVFLALGIGILIGSAFGGDVVESTRRNLEGSLEGNLDAARNRADELAGELERSNEFAERVYPAIVGDRLGGETGQPLRIGVVALGGLPDDLAGDIETALEPSGGQLVEVAVVSEPPDFGALGSELQQTRFFDLAENTDTQEAFARGVGRQLMLGGTLLERVRGLLLSRASGEFGPLDGLIVVRQQPDGLEGEDRSQTGTLEAGILDAATATRFPVVGVEREDTDPSSIGFLSSHGLSTVDDLDRVAGRVALVFALLGAEGNFGTKESADRLLPDLLTSSLEPVPTGGAP
jgi:Copper transport outer membrane protein, MctB